LAHPDHSGYEDQTQTNQKRTLERAPKAPA